MVKMKKIDSDYDELLKSNYDLFAVRFSDLKKEVKSWYSDLDLKDYDCRSKYEMDVKSNNNITMLKVCGIASTQFYAYMSEDGTMYLMDGFSRLLTDYGTFKADPIVYLKVLKGDLPDNKLMDIMFRLNVWKISSNGGSVNNFTIRNFLDRGFRLFLKSKFNIVLVDRFRHDDIEIINQYFKDENSSVGYFNYDVMELFKIFSNECIIEDFKEIIAGNTYSEFSSYNRTETDINTTPFSNYKLFLEGYAKFLSRRRLHGDTTEHKLETYLDILKTDKKFFKKIQGMSGNDSTRINIFNFFYGIELKLNNLV